MQRHGNRSSRAMVLGVGFTVAMAASSLFGGCLIDDPNHCANRKPGADPVCSSSQYCTVGPCQKGANGCVDGDPTRDFCSVDHCWRQKDPDGACDEGFYCSRHEQAEVKLALCVGAPEANDGKGWRWTVAVDAIGCTARIPDEEDPGGDGDGDGDTGGMQEDPMDLDPEEVFDRLSRGLDPDSWFCRQGDGIFFDTCDGRCPFDAPGGTSTTGE